MKACNGYCEAPNSVHHYHIISGIALLRRAEQSYGASFEISTSPKLLLNSRKERGKMVEQPGIMAGLEVGHIGSAGGKAFEWNHQPLGPYGTNLELSSRNPPI